MWRGTHLGPRAWPCPYHTAAEDCPDCLLAGGMVRGGVEQVTGGMGLHTAELVDQGLVGCPREEHTDDVHIDDIRKGVALL